MIIKEKKTCCLFKWFSWHSLVIALIIIYVVRYTAIIKSRKINEISKTRIKTSFFLNQSFLACCTKIICVLLEYCMVTLWQVIFYLDRFSSHLKLHEKTHFITLKVVRENRSKYKITCHSVTKQYASNTHIIFVQHALQNIDIKNNKFYTCFQDFIYFYIFLTLYIYNFAIFYTWN